MKEKRTLSITFIISIMILIVIGIAMMFSVSFTSGLHEYRNYYYFIIRQLIWITAGGFFMIVASRINYKRHKKIRGLFFIGGFALLVLVLIIGKEVNGAKRWLVLGPIVIQPSEVAKIAFIIYLSGALEYYKDKKYKSLEILIAAVVPLFIFIVLIFMEKSFSSAVILFVIGFSMIFVSKVKIEQLIVFFFGFMALGAFGIMHSEYRRRRIFNYLTGFNKDGNDVGYQARQSLIAIGSGRVIGRHYGNGLQKYFYLPERHTDYIFSTYAEEFGFIGCFVLIGIYFFILLIMIMTINKTKDYFGKYLVFGIMVLFITQALANMFVVTGVIPSTGITLPLISYGGSSTIVIMAALGIVINVINNIDEVNEDE